MKRWLQNLCYIRHRKLLVLVLTVLVLGSLYVVGTLGWFSSTEPQPVQIKTVIRTVGCNHSEPNKMDSRVASDIKLTYYEPNRKYTITSYQKAEPQCSGPACRLNRGRRAVEVRLKSQSQCQPISKCVTVNIKTRHRYTDVQMFIDSIHKYYPDLPIVVADEFNPKYDGSAWANSTTVSYIQTKRGVGYGRKMAAMISETPYVLVADDDYMFSPKTDVRKLAEILENSDADIVAGTTDDSFPFAGAIRVSSEHGQTLLSLYPGIFYGVIPNYRNCYHADIVKTFFLARKDVILNAGSWDTSRQFYEHEDFFFQMRDRGVSVVLCDDVIVRHVARTRDLADYRRGFFDDMKSHLLHKWTLTDYFSCTVPKTYMDVETCPGAKRKHFH